jgi:hypothetical protein
LIVAVDYRCRFFAIDFCHVACLCCRRSLSTFAVEFLRS